LCEAIFDQASTAVNSTLDVEKSLIESFNKIHTDMGKSKVSELSGSTCCAVLFKGRTMYTANVGDSRAILVNRKGHVTVLTTD
jgi:serine/threonine protein phosphatase PrpC